MIAATTDRLDRLDHLLDLRRRWKAHEFGQLAFSNSVGAHFGYRSHVGRIVNRYTILHSEVPHAIETVMAAEFRVPQRPRLPDPSAASRAMIETQTSRRSARVLVPMPLACLHAARAYAVERLALIGEVIAESINSRTGVLPGLRHELHAWQNLRAALYEIQGATT